MATINELPSIVTPDELSVIVVTDESSSKKITISDLRNTMVRVASTATAGAVKVGTGLRIDGAGVLSVTNTTGYTLPPATAGSLGGVIVGSGLTITSQGVLSTTGLAVPVASPYVSGTVKIGVGLTMEEGVLNNTVPPYSLPAATQSVLGGVKVGQGLRIDEHVLSTQSKPYAMESNQVISEDYTISNGTKSYSIGPVTIDRNRTVEVGRTASWTIYTPGATENYQPPTPPAVPIQEQDTLISANYSIANNKIASSIGPITVARAATVEVAPLSTWVIF